MHYSDHATEHPVPLNKREPMPCGCHIERRAIDDQSWCYIHYVKPGCRFDGRKVGLVRRGKVYVDIDATEIEVARRMDESRNAI